MDWTVLLKDEVQIDKKIALWLSVAIVVLLYGYFLWVIFYVEKSVSDNDTIWEETLTRLAVWIVEMIGLDLFNWTGSQAQRSLNLSYD